MRVGSILASVVALALVGGASAQAQSIKDFPDVADTSFVQANGHKVLRIAIDVPAPRQAVWERFTTTEGYRAWAVPVAKVEARLGGLIEGSYDFKARIGDADNIRNEIVAITPGQMLMIRNVNAPKALPGREAFAEIATMMAFEDIDGGARVTLTAVGYKPGEPYDTLYRHFGWGNAYSLVKLKESFTKGPIDWAKVQAQQQARAASATVTGRN